MNKPQRFADYLRRHLTALLGLLLFGAVFLLYASSVPPVQVPGDPSEYTFIPWILGIAHPPGYGFYTLLAALWQRLVPIGSVAYRTHLLAAAAGALSAVLVYAIVQRLVMRPERGTPVHKFEAHLPAIFAGLSLAAATDVWQHSIHTNAHIITLLFAAASVFLLIEWWRSGKDRWLYLFAVIAGFSPAQHLLLVFAFPAYLIFIILVKPRLFIQPKKILGLIGCFLLGLSVFLYYPLRSPSAPFGPNDITSLESFIHFVSAEGLRVNLFHYALADQPVRFGVFVDLLQLQYSGLGILVAIPGAIWLARTALKPFILCAVFLVSLYVFIINTVQDVMAYLLLPFMMIAIFAGLGVWVLTLAFAYSARLRRNFPLSIGLALLLLPIGKLVDIGPRVTLRDYTVGSDWVNTVFDRFAGRGEHAVLLAPWEAMTPLWVAQYTEGRTLDPKDVAPVYVTTASQNPWLDNVFAHLNEGPVYLADYRRAVVEGGLFRLRPEGAWPLWRVVPPGDTSVPPLDHLLNAKAGEGENTFEILGYSLDRDTVEAGQAAHLTLAMRAPLTPTHIIMPYVAFGNREYRWTTDSRLLTPEWRPNEVVVERYDLTPPFNTPPGEYGLKLHGSDLSAGRDLDLNVDLGSLQVIEPTRPHFETAQDEVADFSAQIALIGATANGVRHTDPLPTIAVKPGESIGVWLNWLAQQQVDESYTIFVHLIDANNQLHAQQDYTPMGGAFPTQLWIPQWIEGQIVNDPYQIKVPDDLPPGDYFIEAGMYGMTSQRRVPIIGHDGGLAGDRIILFKVKVQSE